MNFFSLVRLIFISFICANNAFAVEESLPNWQEETLSGDWGGTRASLYQKGIDLAFSHKSDLLANLSGGLSQGTSWLGHTEMQATLDLDKLFGWSSTTAFVHYHSDLGAKFNEHRVGAFMGADNIEVANNTAQFYQAWLQKNWLDDRFSVLAGLYAVDSEFYVIDSSGVFIQPPYGMANELAQAGSDGPPIFPVGALALRVKYVTPDKQFYIQGALTDGVPGNPDDADGTHIKLGNGDGTLSILELGFTPVAQEGEISKTAIGVWGFTKQLDDLTSIDANGNPENRSSQGIYLIAERSLTKGLTGFLRYGMANKDVHQADWTGSLGLNYQGLIVGRDDDVAGIAVTVNHASRKYRRLANSDNQEVDVELTYRAQVKHWLAIQPTLQYFANPSMDKILKDATVFGVRTEIAF